MAHRFFESETATFGVIVESEVIPWVVSPGDYAADHVSWEALDIAIRRYTLDQVAQILPKPSPLLQEPQKVYWSQPASLAWPK